MSIVAISVSVKGEHTGRDKKGGYVLIDIPILRNYKKYKPTGTY